MNGASSNQLFWSSEGYSYTIYTLMDMNGWSSNSPHCSWVPYFVRPILHLWGCYNKSHYKIGTSWIDPNMFGSSVNECPRVRLQHPQLIPGVWFLNDTYTYGTVDTYGFVGPADFVPWKHSCKLGQNPCDPHRHRWRWFAWFYEDGAKFVCSNLERAMLGRRHWVHRLEILLLEKPLEPFTSVHSLYGVSSLG